MKFFLTPEAHKGLSFLDGIVKRRVLKKLQEYSTFENPIAFAKSLTATKGYYRFRVGDIRIIFRIDNSVIVVSRIGRRDSVYE